MLQAGGNPYCPKVERPGNREMRFEPARCNGSSKDEYLITLVATALFFSRRMPVGLHRVAGSNPAGSTNSYGPVAQVVEQNCRWQKSCPPSFVAVMRIAEAKKPRQNR